MERHQLFTYLGNEAARLLEEFRTEACMLGENPIKKITYLPNELTIRIEEITDEVLHYSLSEMEYIFKDNNDGFNICGVNYEDGIKLAKREADLEYGQVSKNLFINYVGSIIYSQYRCEEICKRILEIQKEVNII